MTKPRKKKYRWLKAILYIHLFLIFLAVCFGIDVYITNKSDYKNSIQHTPFQAIIVPGVPYHGKQMSDIMRMRVLWAKYLYDTGKTTHIIFSGSAVYSPYIEAEVMAAYAEKLGIPKSAITVEPEAEHSSENVYYGYKLAKKAGFQKIALTTDPFQSYFLKLFAKEHNIKMNFLPFQFDMDSIFDVDLDEITIDVKKQDPFEPLPEREGFFQRFDGTLGRHIPRDANNDIVLFKE